MKTIIYDNEIYWQCTGISAIRPYKEDRLKILNIAPDGTITHRIRHVSFTLVRVVEDQFKGCGINVKRDPS